MRCPGLQPDKKTAPFYLQAAYIAVVLFESIEPGLAGIRQSQPEETSGLMF